MPKVTRQRAEYKTHDFDLPEGMDPESEEAQAIYDDYDWGNRSVYHAEEETTGVFLYDGEELNPWEAEED